MRPCQASPTTACLTIRSKRENLRVPASQPPPPTPTYATLVHQGLVEQYAGFEEVLKRLLDPGSKHEDLWGLYSTHQFNT